MGRRENENTNKSNKPYNDNSSFEAKPSMYNQTTTDSHSVRKQVDPETTRYFWEIQNLFENEGMDIEERPIVCGNALEEVRGKELELATDAKISHVLQTLIEGCDLDHLCVFLRGCAKSFLSIAMDRAGSHVIETAMKALALHLQEQENYTFIEETLVKICKVIAVNPIDMMCNCYGSHVLRSLLCLCKGVPLDSLELHGVKSSKSLADRLNMKNSRFQKDNIWNTHSGFPDLLNLVVSGILKCDKKKMYDVLGDQFGCLVLQTTLKLLSGHDQELLQLVPVFLGCEKDNLVEENLIDGSVRPDILEWIKETAYSHLMEVILEVSPESLFDEIFSKIFKDSLFEASCDQCGSFVIQALISRTRNQDQMEIIWEQLGSKFLELLENGRSGVIASLISASQKLHSNEQECCDALVSAMCSTEESPTCIVPRLLFLDNYFRYETKSNWSWPSGTKMHVMGCLILQEIFSFESVRVPVEFEIVQPYLTSITSMEAEYVLETAKDPGGARVIEAFLSSNASVKLKRRLITKLRGHFGELAKNSSGCFTVEKCFTASNLSLREAIASDLLAVRAEIFKTRQGPYLLRKLEIDRFADQPDHWKQRQESIQAAYKEFEVTFGSGEPKSSKKDSFLSENANVKSSQQEGLKNMREEIEHKLTPAAPSQKRHREGGDGRKEENKKSRKRTEKSTENAAKMPFLSSEMPERKVKKSKKKSKA
ncbi:hypothetical protein ACFE04_000569 [Oxalis oulophora]